MKGDEILTCAECGGEGRLIRINAQIVRAGHSANPRHRMHPFTVARSADDRSRKGSEEPRRQSREREDAPARTLIATRGARNGRSRTASPPGHSVTQLSGQGASTSGHPPAPAPRLALTAGPSAHRRG